MEGWKIGRMEGMEGWFRRRRGTGALQVVIIYSELAPTWELCL